MSEVVLDKKERLQAIDPLRSFIVQAPAGSGKTELLIQRFLQLLSRVEKYPEEIIAITFTRKAAAEMRQRILIALKSAERKEPESEHQKLTWRLAKKALERDIELHWKLQKNPHRLRILTIDGLSYSLVKQMPVSAQLSPQLNILDNPFSYYQEATRQVLLNYPMENLLLHLDNRVTVLENLFIEILSKREQWLPHIVGHQKSTKTLRQHLENALQNISIECMKNLQLHLSPEILSELIPLADAAGEHCEKHDPENPIAHCRGLTRLTHSLEAFPVWLGIAHLLLTQKGEWRKSVTKNQGFPAKSPLKKQMIEFLEFLSSNESLKNHLQSLLLCPPLQYQEDQWNIIETLTQRLPLLVAELNLLFARENVTDFIELNLAALRALGEDDNPTDLALHLDYRINHLLVDEFQDTSIIHFELIKKLTRGWSVNDGRTLFLVGDPMQSIYRFRHAEVGLFLRIQEEGFPNIPLESLTLQQNFRSRQSLVHWHNESFQHIFDKKSDTTVGATPYCASYSTNFNDGEIQWHLSSNDEDGVLEAKEIVTHIKKLKINFPRETIGILIRSRLHARAIIERLHQENILFQAVDLEPLSHLIEIQDIHTLLRALLHRADRIAWLSILRAPYCGLTLRDLTILSESSKKNSLWTTLKKFESISQLSDDAKLRLSHVVPILFDAIKNSGRLPYSQLLRELWQSLDGPVTLNDQQQAINIENYFQLIESLENKNILLSLSEMDESLNRLYGKPNPQATSQLQIMTIHKSKGLEFDHVFLPGMHRKAPADKTQIIKWLERPNLQGNSDLILAPIKSIEQKNDPIYSFLNKIDKEKSSHECARLLYVATTRAKKSLHLFANISLDEDKIKLPIKGTFLNLLWNDAQSYCEIINNEPEIIENKLFEKKLRRFSSEYFESKNKLPRPTLNDDEIENNTTNPVDIHWDNLMLRSKGTIIHEALQYFAQGKTYSKDRILLRLRQYNIPDHEFSNIQTALLKTQQDPRGQWILSSEHKEAYAEFPLTFFDNEQLKQIIIDRTFVENGIRWIIDYKTGTSNPEELNLYHEQLKFYANIFKNYDDRPIRIGVYFPLTSEWVEF